jgi:hypothetical protein
MTRHALRAGVLMQVVLWVLTAPAAATDNQPGKQTQRTILDLFHIADARSPFQDRDVRPFHELRHRLYLEMDGARLQAEDWLRAAGVSLLVQRDSDGHRSYQLISGALVDNWPVVRLHARVGGPELSTGLQPHREIPAIGFTIPGESCTFEFEGLRDRRLGTALMAHLHWGKARDRVQYGVAVPLTLGGSIGALFQLHVRLDE